MSMVAGIRIPRYCFLCGSPLTERYVEEEERDRLVCENCGHIHYRNPTPVAGTIPLHEGGAWLLRRAIEPRLGYWTFPAGFMELGESAEQAAMRETREELNLDVQITELLNVYSYAGHQNVHIIYLADALSSPSLGTEALEYALFAPDTVPWDDLAFNTTAAALRDWISKLGRDAN
jgi:ADP-ribose pyrophosphatase YjhB (NUDIX family)